MTPKVADTSSASSTGIVDTTTWQFWWDNNKDAYLDLRRHVRSGGPRTPQGDFIVIGGNGIGNNGSTLSLMPNKAEIQRSIVPALYDLIDSDDSTEIVRNALLSLAKIGVDQMGTDARRVQDTLVEHVADRNDRISEAAVVGLGLLGNWSAAHTLTDLLRDTAEGRRLISSNKIPTRLRAQAAYAMGLLAERTTNSDVRRFCIHKLTQDFPGERSSLREVRIACVTAVGLVGLKSNGMSPRDVEGLPAATSRETQLAWLLEKFEGRNTDDSLRAQIPIALARLTDGAAPEWRTVVTKSVLGPVSRGARAANSVRQSCVLALGRLADADGDKIDKDTRKTLQRLTSDTNQETRNFAIIALAQVGGRAGQGSGDAYQGTKGVRKHLLYMLARGKKRQHPWAGLALGVMGHSLREAGAPLSKDTGRALERMLDECRNPADVGAYAIAIGLRRDEGLATVLTETMADYSDAGATSAIAIACGLFGDNEALEGLRTMVDESKNAPASLAQAAIALALLDDKTISRRLGEMLGNAKGLASQASITTAMGFIGDRNAVAPLVASVRDEKRTDQARAFAAMALGMVADKDDEPWQASLTEGINYHAPAASLSAGNGTGLLEMP